MSPLAEATDPLFYISFIGDPEQPDQDSQESAARPGVRQSFQVDK
jgi:hypothetical protein